MIFTLLFLLVRYRLSSLAARIGKGTVEEVAHASIPQNSKPLTKPISAAKLKNPANWVFGRALRSRTPAKPTLLQSPVRSVVRVDTKKGSTQKSSVRD